MIPPAPKTIKDCAALEALDKLFPPNTVVNLNGDLEGGWELDPEAVIALEIKIGTDPRYELDPGAEEIEVVILAIKDALRRGQI